VSEKLIKTQWKNSNFADGRSRSGDEVRRGKSFHLRILQADGFSFQAMTHQMEETCRGVGVKRALRTRKTSRVEKSFQLEFVNCKILGECNPN
jgi:hypothetical protein